jgi:hypothetical protein
MKDIIKKLLQEGLLEIKKIPIENEIFSAYNGRYLFDIDKLYKLIYSNQIPYITHTYSPIYLAQFSHKNFSLVDSNKLKQLKKTLDLSKPLGILVKFKNPEDKTDTGEWILVDGNHRVRAANALKKNADLFVVDMTKIKQKDINKFMLVNKDIPHNLYPDDDIE